MDHNMYWSQHQIHCKIASPLAIKNLHYIPNTGKLGKTETSSESQMTPLLKERPTLLRMQSKRMQLWGHHDMLYNTKLNCIMLMIVKKGSVMHRKHQGTYSSFAKKLLTWLWTNRRIKLFPIQLDHTLSNILACLYSPSQIISFKLHGWTEKNLPLKEIKYKICSGWALELNNSNVLMVNNVYSSRWACACSAYPHKTLVTSINQKLTQSICQSNTLILWGINVTRAQPITYSHVPWYFAKRNHPGPTNNTL